MARAAWSFTSVAHLATGDTKGALAAADRALALDANDAVATFIVAMALRRQRDPRADAWLARARTLAPNDSVISAALASQSVLPLP